MYLPDLKQPNAPSGHTGTATILLVDDNDPFRGVISTFLQASGYKVLEARSASEASMIAAHQENPIDLLLTDVMLPGASGRELAERIRETRPDLKVLYVSGYTDDDAVRAGAIPPGSKFLQKPFTLGSLLAKVRESLA